MSTVLTINEVRGVVRIVFDDAEPIRIRKKHFMQSPVEVGEEINTDAYIDSIASLQLCDAYETALSKLDVSEKTSVELMRALINAGYVQPAAEAVIQRLVDAHLIDDARYAERLAQSKTNRPVGINAVKQKLRAKGISEEDVDNALECFDDEQQLKSAIEALSKLIRRYEEKPLREKKAKLSQALARRGFGWNIISEAIEQVLTDEFDD